MTLSPWHVASMLNLNEVAALLAGEDPTELRGIVPRSDREYAHVIAWKHQIIKAVKEEKLAAIQVRRCAYPNRLTIITGSRETYVTDQSSWRPILLDQLDVDVGNVNNIDMDLDRQEVYRWLKETGVDENNIPGPLRITSDGCGEKGSSDGGELRTSETLGLLLNGLAKNHRNYRNGDHINRAKIIETMHSALPEGIYGMQKSKIHEVLNASLEAWERRKKE